MQLPAKPVRAAAFAAVLALGLYPIAASARQAAGSTAPPAGQTPQSPAGRGQRGGGPGGGDPWPGMKKLLAVADVQSGFHHDSISHALATVEQIGRKSGVYATMIRTDSQLITNDPIVGHDRYEGRGVNARV